MTDNGRNKHFQNAQDVIAELNLEPHVEGGYFRRTFQTDHQPMAETAGGQRYLMSSIYYLLTRESPIGYFHLNRSDILHYYHLGDAIQYCLIFPNGTLKTVVMGSDILAGQCLQLHVPGGVWKASQLTDGSEGFGLISEAVSPGFDFADMEMGSQHKLGEQFPEHWELVQRLTRE
ncbi:cupin domain-containing protein [Pseudomonas sp. NPDC086251]|jgi:predicted cupin superfamily sugar epimerase|uniref:cupin domain-containing protein n=1 Tax=Pseudomonas sp. NPDC086251 TaxID=3364431 RepID=UPI003835FFBD